MKSCKVCITTKSTLASLLFKGLATKHRTVKWSIMLEAHMERCIIGKEGKSSFLWLINKRFKDFNQSSYEQLVNVKDLL